MDLLVYDTSVLVDLERGNLLNEAFRLPYRLVVPDLLYERELRNHGGDELLALGLEVAELTAVQVENAHSCRRERPALSLPDVFALALARAREGTLLTGDSRLRSIGTQKGVLCRGLLWLLDEMLLNGISAESLHTGLQMIEMHPRCRLPKREVNARLARYAAVTDGSDSI